MSDDREGLGPVLNPTRGITSGKAPPVKPKTEGNKPMKTTAPKK